ncbi:MAG TPA: AgmX/PglI C-terminal domain-containing protein [Kofleriaceae bacterium]|nr:AgmX/PglI C-terminal domain-containing protein [Kofleriaceae bacterium]
MQHTQTSLPPPIPSHQDEKGARAIEVAAMLGDTVVGVRHLRDPRGGALSRRTLGLIGGAALLIAMAIAAFAAGVKNEANNARAFTDWVDRDGKPAADFRPLNLGVGYDWLAFGGLLGGLACAATALVRARRERVPASFRIGTAAGVDFPTSDAPADSFELVAPRGDEFMLHVGAGMTATRLADNQTVTGETTIAAGARYRVELGQQTLLVSSVPAPRAQATPVWGGLDGNVAKFAAASLLAHAAFIMLVNTMPSDQRALNDDALGAEDRLVLIRAQAKEDPIQKEEEVLDGNGAADPAGQPGAAMALASGKMGDKNATRPTGRYQMEKTSDKQVIAQTPNQAIDRAKRAGVLGFYMANREQWTSMTGTGDLTSGNDATTVYGGLQGHEIAAAYGGWGYGIDGVGPGAGGTSWGTVGAGKYGLIGNDGPGGKGWGPGGPGGGLRMRREPKGPVVDIGRPSSVGDLDANIIRRYIRRKLARIRHCYEKELVVNQDLAGTVMVQFQISPNGAVQGTSAGGMGNKNVEGCVGETVSSIQFPKPQGGGMVNVRYPFVFQPAG